MQSKELNQKEERAAPQHGNWTEVGSPAPWGPAGRAEPSAAQAQAALPQSGVRTLKRQTKRENQAGRWNPVKFRKTIKFPFKSFQHLSKNIYIEEV